MTTADHAAMLAKCRGMTYDELANVGIRLERLIERGCAVGAASAAERAKLAIVDQVLQEKERAAGA